MTKKLSERLSRARKHLDLSQEYVASKMGVHRTTITAIELGKRKVSAEELAFFSTLYGVSLDALLYGSNDTLDAKMFTRAFSTLSDKDKHEIMSLIEFKKRLKER